MPAHRRLTPAERCTEAYELYLLEVRGLAKATNVNYGPSSVRFSRTASATDPSHCHTCAPVTSRNLYSGRRRICTGSEPSSTSALRSFLQYARYRGKIKLDLAAAVPAVANWSMSSIPGAIPADQVRQLLASIDRGTPAGCRDYAILLLLARLGLRSGEVASLELDNIDWNVGQLSVRGKSGQRTELPLSAEVGEAIATYLRRGRPQSASRRVFLRVKPPIRGFRGASGVGSIVHHRLQRAGIEAPTTGPISFDMD